MGELYRQTNTGVIMHMFDKTEDSNSPWLACVEDSESQGCSWQPKGRLSFLVLNHLAWNDAEQVIPVFGSSFNAVGYIGTQTVTAEKTDCIFPGDGGTMRRDHDGCGCMVDSQECGSDNWNWCPM